MRGGGGLPRRFLNVIADNHTARVQTLRCIDLTRHKLFNTTTPIVPVWGGEPAEQQPRQATMAATTSSPWVVNNRKKPIRLPAPAVHFQGAAERLSWHVDCFPLAGRKVLCVDTSGQTLLFDAVTRQSSLDLPYPHSKCWPVPIFVADDDCGGGHGGSIYIMEGRPGWKETTDEPSQQYEAFIYQSKSKSTSSSTTSSGWKRQLLRPPPFVCDPKVAEPTITSHAVLHGGAGGSASHICISGNDDAAGTYCLDTATHTWTKAGDWTLPFIGKVEYVPERKLWFGIVHGGGGMGWQLGAADLSTMGSREQPRLVGTWKELEVPQGWRELARPQLANLGSGRFCIARFFCRDTIFIDSHHLIEHEEYFTVLTGADVVPAPRRLLLDRTNNVDGNGSNGLKLQLQMIRHNSRFHSSHSEDGNIKLVF